MSATMDQIKTWLDKGAKVRCWLWKWLWCSWAHRRHRCYPEVWDRGLDGPWHCAKCHSCWPEGLDKLLEDHHRD